MKYMFIEGVCLILICVPVLAIFAHYLNVPYFVCLLACFYAGFKWGKWFPAIINKLADILSHNQV